MYTTLELLKKSDACIPGYTRMISFFGTNADLKAVKIPLYMVSLIGEPDDVSWTVANSLMIDKDMYAKFRATHLHRVLHKMFWTAHGEPDDQKWHDKSELIIEARKDFIHVIDSNSAELWIEKYSQYNFNHFIWNEVLNVDALHNPVKFILYVLERYTSEIHRTQIIAYAHPEDFDLNPHQREYRGLKPVQSRRGTVSEAGLAKKYYFAGFSPSRNKNHNWANILNYGNDPYQEIVEFMFKNDLGNKGRLKGMMLSQASDKEPPGYHMTVNVTSAENIFRVYHTMSAQNFDVNDILGVNRVAHALSQTLSNVGLRRASGSLDNIVIEGTEAVNINNERRGRLVTSDDVARDREDENSDSEYVEDED